jgi:signal peptidase I
MRLAVEGEGRAGELDGTAQSEQLTVAGAPSEAIGTGEPEQSAAVCCEETRLPVAGGAGAAVEATHHRHGILEAIQSLLYVMVIALFIVTFIVQPFRIPSESMEPTLLVGDFLLVDKEVGIDSEPLAFVATNAVHRGDVIVFHYPVDAKLHLVKRVIGVPGDHVRLRDGHAYVDGRALAEPYAMFVPAGPDGYRDDFPRLTSAEPGIDSRWWIQMHTLVANGELTVPAGSYFVLGDNRNDSEDSRYWGLVPQAAIVGKPFLIYFSLNNAGATPGQASAAAMQGGAGSGSDAGSGPLARFARWERALRIIR